jgi:predicted Fe-Mo cluster-binding NifX family protein
VKRTNAERASFIFDNKAKAQEKALEMARHEHVDVVIHDEDGKVEQHLAPV